MASRSAPGVVGAPAQANRAQHAFSTPGWPVLILVFILGMNRAIVGLFGIDLVAVIFGAMTPAARAVYVIFGIAAIYYVAITLVSGERRR
jgi:hypothetical protein